VTSRRRRRARKRPLIADALAAAKEKARSLCEGDRSPPVALNTGEIEWYTPPEYLEPVRAVLGDIDLERELRWNGEGRA